MRTASLAAAVCVGAALILASSPAGAIVYMSVPDTTAGRGDTLWVPIYSTDVSEADVYSYQLIVSFDSTFVEIIGVSNEGAFTDAAAWMDPAWHIIEGEDSLRIASAGTSPLTGEGLFMLVGLTVLSAAPSDSSMFIGLHECILNEGVPPVSPDGGWLFVTTVGVPTDAGAGADPFTLERLSPRSVRWSITEMDARDVSLEIYDAFGRFVTSLSPDSSAERASFTWEGDNSEGEAVSGGVYFFRLRSGQSQWSGKVCVLR